MLKEMFKKTKYISLDGYTDEKRKPTAEAKNNLVLKNKNTNQNRIQSLEENITEETDRKPSVPDGMWMRCESCGDTLYTKDVLENYNCCPNCNAHFRIGAEKRIQLLMDEGSFSEWDKNLSTKNVLDFPNYEDKIRKLQLQTGMIDAVITGEGKIKGENSVIAVMDPNFMMGSMGQVVGEKITRAIENATSKKLPIIIFTASGGARMQEGIVSLMQMAKTSAALKRHSDEGLLYITVLTDPTTGGVTASFATLGDVILAEAGALIGFAGPRVIEQTIGQKLPDGFQKAEFLLEKGFVDRVVDRKNLKEELYRLLKFHTTMK
nr:acetyl-CoA carboxylase, carboxyltransferase subunit beta [Anaeromicropila herbilytica]